MNARRGLILVIALFSCGERRVDPCGRALRQLDEAVMGRMQGLTAADDIPEQARLMSRADACVDTSNRPRVEAHARALAARLSAAGSHAELLSLSRLLAALPVSAELRASTRAAAEVAEVFTAEDGDGTAPDARARARRMVTGKGEAPAGNTEVVVTRQAWDAEGVSCALVVPGADAPRGGVQARVLRQGRSVALVDSIPVTTWSAGRAAPLPVCIGGPFTGGDQLLLGTDTEKRALELAADAQARVAGALRARLQGRSVAAPAECMGAAGATARACALGWPASPQRQPSE